MKVTRTARPLRLAGVTAACVAVLVLAAACGTSSASGSAVAGQTSASASQDNQTQRSRNGQGQGAQQRSAANGMIAAVNGTTMQVQSASSQTTVNFSDSTTITASQTADLSAVTVGACITAAIPTGGVPASGSAAPTPMPSSSGSPTRSTGPFTATTVQLRDPVNGQCTGGFGGFGGGAPGVSGAPLPSGAPTAAPGQPSGGAPPSGAPQNGQGFGGQGLGDRASGTVASVSGDTIVVSETDPQTQQASQRTVTVTGSTTYAKTASATTDALKVGQCAVVQGSSDNKGAVTATSIAVSSPPAGSTTCTTGFGGRGRGGQGSAAPTTTGS